MQWQKIRVKIAGRANHYVAKANANFFIYSSNVLKVDLNKKFFILHMQN
jgi:hypothetical protein